MVLNTPTAQRRRQVEDLLEAVGMTDQRHKKPDQLSGGQETAGGHRPGPGNPARAGSGG